MILADVRAYLQQRHRVALNDLCNRFQTDADALRGMLAVFINKGKLKKLPAAQNCKGGCCHCDPALTEMYEWVD